MTRLGTLELKSGESIGWLTFFEDFDSIKVNVAHIDSESIGNGYGKKMYVYLLNYADRKNKILKSDTLNTLSDQSRYLWNSLVYLGLARFVKEGMYFEGIPLESLNEVSKNSV